MAERGKRPTLNERFWKYVDKNGECWNWIGTKNRLGYGIIGSWDGGKQKTLMAHRLSFKINNGFLTPGLCVCHTCDNRSCVNPKHLWEATHKENMRDMSLKGRSKGKKGESNGNAKLTRDMVKEIREIYKSGEFSHEGLAETFNISKASVYYIVNNISWKQV